MAKYLNKDGLNPLHDITFADRDKYIRTIKDLKKKGITEESPNFRKAFIDYFENELGGYLILHQEERETGKEYIPDHMKKKKEDEVPKKKITKPARKKSA